MLWRYVLCHAPTLLWNTFHHLSSATIVCLVKLEQMCHRRSQRRLWLQLSFTKLKVCDNIVVHTHSVMEIKWKDWFLTSRISATMAQFMDRNISPKKIKTWWDINTSRLQRHVQNCTYGPNQKDKWMFFFTVGSCEEKDSRMWRWCWPEQRRWPGRGKVQRGADQQHTLEGQLWASLSSAIGWAALHYPRPADLWHRWWLRRSDYQRRNGRIVSGSCALFPKPRK